MPVTAKFINARDRAVDDALRGLVLSNAYLKFHPSCPRVVLGPSDPDHVAIIAGGGSGHEPFAAGLVGPSLLTAAVCGNVFASPPTQHVLAALEETRRDDGAILFVINYTGDRLNFGLAAERFRESGGKARLVSIADDVAIEDEGRSVGRRGLAAATFVIKIACSMAKTGRYSLDEIADFAEKVIDNCGTLGVSLAACSPPGSGPLFQLPEGMMEVGLGIHGERGRERAPLESAKTIMQQTVSSLVASRLQLKQGSTLIGLLNNLGGTSQLEMSILAGEFSAACASHSLSITRFLSGTFMTSLDGHGVSVSLLCLDRFDETERKQILEHIDSSATSAAWKAFSTPPAYSEIHFDTVTEEEIQNTGARLNPDESAIVRDCLEAACAALIDAAPLLDRLDGAAGDGDCGQTIAEAANIILSSLSSLAFSQPQTLLRQLSRLFETRVGGTTGAIYALMLSAASTSFSSSCFPSDFRDAIRLATQAVSKYGGAQPGDRTMVDTLTGFLRALPTDRDAHIKRADWVKAVEAAKSAAASTASMRATAGRASYTAEGGKGEPDAGATAAAVWIEAIGKALAAAKTK